MPPKERISRQQMMWIYANGLLGASLLFLPQVLAADAKQDAWITAILGGILGLVIVSLYVALALRFPNLSPVEYFKAVLGRPLGVLALLTILIFLFWLVLAQQSEVSGFFALNYPETPRVFVALCFTLIGIYMLIGGIEVIARVHDLLFPVIILGVSALLGFAAPQYQVESLQPVLADGLRPVLTPLRAHLAFPYGNAVLFLMVFPFIRKPKDLPYAAICGSMIGSTIIVAITLFALLTIGPSSVARVLYPPHFGARTITIAGFLAGLDGVVDVIWIFSNTLRIAVLNYASILLVSQLLGVSSYRYLVIPFSALTFTCTPHIYRNLAEQIEFLTHIETIAAPVAFLLVPLVVLVVAIIRKLDGRRLSHD